MDTSRKSSLKVWIVTPGPILGAKSSIGIQCPHDDCGGKAIVNERKWRRGKNLEQSTKTRACTYCFRASWVSEKAKRQHESHQ